jgi:TRAP-type C4-dicarboxylate transport system permease small subunit
MRKLLDGLYLGSGYLAGFFLFLVFAIMIVMSAGRQFGLNIPAGDDFAAWAMAAMSFLGLAHTFKRGEIIRVGLLLERLNGRPKQVFELLALGISLVAISYFSWHCSRMVYDSWRFNDMAQGAMDPTTGSRRWPDHSGHRGAGRVHPRRRWQQAPLRKRTTKNDGRTDRTSC